jgi:hypothetical protein
MSEMKFRLAVPTDAEAFSRWVIDNPQIDPKDVEAAQKKNNPTVLYFAVENSDGVVVMFAPFYLQLTLAHLGFNPATDAEERKHAMAAMLDGVIAFGVQYGIREFTTVSQEKYPVARWALAHGFSQEPRQLFKFDVNRVLEVATKVEE